MLAMPTTTVTIKRGTAIDEYSGEISNETSASTGVPMSIMEQSRTVIEPTTGTPMVIRFVTGRVDPSVDIRRNDRILDENDADIYYMVLSVRQVQNPIVVMDKVLDLKRVDPNDP